MQTDERKVFLTTLQPHPIEASSAFKMYMRRPGLRGLDTLRRSVTRFLREMPPVDLNSVTVTHIASALERLSVKGYNPSYIDKLFRRTRGFFQWCRDEDYLHHNPMLGVRPDRTDRVFVPTVIPHEDMSALHRHIMSRNIAEEIVLWGALRMGARLSEPCMATIGDVLNGRTPKEFFADRRIILHTKTYARQAVQPQFAMPAYQTILQERGDDPTAPLLTINHIPLMREDDRLEKMVDNIEPRTLVIRRWLAQMQTELWGAQRWKPKMFRSTFISNELIRNPESILAVAMQCGTSPEVIRQHYLNFLNIPDFLSGEED